eukprot:CAMPEP_0167791286 /NCGR_PEP_ID=MMETSP0111_2-20121227/11844_1 /TAXON_ID=91324 /ORGANISM="Lotharella globosa, Strain CCCM811" /LENGTH=376 /DNA_ID=CAMNT_0007683923 /DNA_START=87 /DNA_END=1217 /DNA_ORIENTATION=+
MEKVLVTGANGFIASHIVKDLLASEKKYAVRGTVRDPTNARKTAFLKALPGAAERLELVALDLLKSGPEGFEAAVAGCTYVLHTASPYPLSSPKTEDELVRPAVEGTLSVLRACAATPSVKRVVVTSSCAAIAYGHRGPIGAEKYNEDTWSEDANMGLDEAYMKSKTMAEKAAWAFMKEEKRGFALTAVNPAGVFGPSVSPNPGTSLEIIEGILTRKIPMIPSVSIGVVDVRDVALTHVKAMTCPEAAGKRIVNSGEELTFADIAETLRDAFGPMGYSPTSLYMPYALVWIGSFFSTDVMLLWRTWGRPFNVDGSNVTKILGIEYRDARQALIESAHALVDHGIVAKTEGYVPASSKAKPEAAGAAAGAEAEKKQD